MPKPRDTSNKTSTERTEAVLDLLSTAIVDNNDACEFGDENPVVDGTQTLPERLRDPFAVLARGAALLRSGIPIRSVESDSVVDDELRAAARNGKTIPTDIANLMKEDRITSEAAHEGTTVEKIESVATDSDRSFPGACHGSSIDRELEIEELATLIALEFMADGRVSLGKIAQAQGVTHSFGHYQDLFDGLLECSRRRFHIYINLDSNNGAETPRARFSFAHELGHYFLDWHRAALDRGIPSHGSLADFESGNIAEREADMFAANLLIPAPQLKKMAGRKVEACDIVRLSRTFGASLTATAIRCAKLNVSPLVVMRWTAEGRAWCWSSEDFQAITKNRAFKSLDRIPTDSATRTAIQYSAEATSQMAQKGTTLSTWFPSVRTGSMHDSILVEECLSLGAHGVLTILRHP